MIHSLVSFFIAEVPLSVWSNAVATCYFFKNFYHFFFFWVVWVYLCLNSKFRLMEYSWFCCCGLQVFSFKLRGAYNMMAKLKKEQLDKGVICSSAGNHAQGVALAAKKLGCDAVIAMPVTTPEIKVGTSCTMSNLWLYREIWLLN